MSRGRFITIEGTDGAGKSSQLATIQTWLKQQQTPTVISREPGGTPIGERLRSLLLGEDQLAICDDTELLMVFAARAAHLHTVILPALKAGKWVISDRFTDASYAYQGARGIATDRIQALEQWTQAGVQPDLTLLFDLPLKMGQARVAQRGEADRFEQEPLIYKERVRQLYLERAEAEPDRIKVIDSSQAIECVSADVVHVLEAFI